MQIVIFLGIVIFSSAFGAIIIASGQVFLAIREIALNTRKEEDKNDTYYNVLLTVAKINNFLGWIVIISGVILGIILTAVSSSRPFYW